MPDKPVAPASPPAPSSGKASPPPPPTTAPPPELLPPPVKTWSLGKTHNTPPPKPRGRFVQVEPGKENLRLLFRPEAKERLGLLLEASCSQAELLSLFSSQFKGEGESLSWQEVASVLEYHGLLAAFESKERAALEAGLLRFRCSLDKLSKAWGMRPGALKKRLEELSLNDAFKKLRKRFAAEVLDAPNVNFQLRILARPGYLKDLGIASALQRQLSAKLRDMLAQLPAELEMPEMRLRELAKKHRLDKNLLASALQQLNIV